MSIIDELRQDVPDRSYALDELTGTQAYEWALHDVREALRNATDEQADAVAAAEYALRLGVSPGGYYRQPKWYREGARETARRWMAAAAGDDR